MTTPLISIIIPAYNVAPYLARALDSILAQTYTNIEIIAVNDGSSDGTAALLDAYSAKDSRIKVIHKQNGGVTSARLRGVAEANGEWIGFMDGDDYIDPDMYERLISNALTHDADISHCGYQMVFPNRTDYYYGTGKLLLHNNITGLSELLSGKIIEPGLWNKLFRKELFRNISTHMDTSIRINEDLLMNYWLFKAAEHTVYEDFCPYHYIVRSGSAANSALNIHLLRDPLRVTHILLKDAPQELYSTVYRKLVYILINTTTMDASGNPELILPFRKECRTELRRNLGHILFRGECNLKLKAMALWAAVWPGSYREIHRMYSRITGHDKKYSLE